jgi:hypothetical protein
MSETQATQPTTVAGRKRAERDESIARLREWLKEGDTVHTVLRKVSTSGMSRVIDVYHFTGKADGTVDKSWLSWHVARACGERFNERPEGVRVNGCGMDMGFHLVYNLAHVLFGDGYKLKQEWL